MDANASPSNHSGYYSFVNPGTSQTIYLASCESPRAFHLSLSLSLSLPVYVERLEHRYTGPNPIDLQRHTRGLESALRVYVECVRKPGTYGGLRTPALPTSCCVVDALQDAFSMRYPQLIRSSTPRIEKLRRFQSSHLHPPCAIPLSFSVRRSRFFFLRDSRGSRVYSRGKEPGRSPSVQSTAPRARSTFRATFR